MDKLDSKPLFNIVSGITILCIIVGSQWYLCPDIITRIIFTFHIPVLFIISGYFLEIKSTRQTLLYTFRTLMIPYFITYPVRRHRHCADCACRFCYQPDFLASLQYPDCYDRNHFRILRLYAPRKEYPCQIKRSTFYSGCLFCSFCGIHRQRRRQVIHGK